MFEDKLIYEKKKYRIIVVANDPKVPGIFGILPRPNIVTNNVFKVLIIFRN